VAWHRMQAISELTDVCRRDCLDHDRGKLVRALQHNRGQVVPIHQLLLQVNCRAEGICVVMYFPLSLRTRRAAVQNANFSAAA
jgi:hypothetical protein